VKPKFGLSQFEATSRCATDVDTCCPQPPSSGCAATGNLGIYPVLCVVLTTSNPSATLVSRPRKPVLGGRHYVPLRNYHPAHFEAPRYREAIQTENLGLLREQPARMEDTSMPIEVDHTVTSSLEVTGATDVVYSRDDRQGAASMAHPPRLHWSA